jgi:FMN-dependent NADH-azoreductase
VIQILAIHSSPRGEDVAVTRRLARVLLNRLKRMNLHTTIVERDLAIDPPQHVSNDLFTGSRKSHSDRSRGEKLAVLTSDVLIDELLACDILVIGAPMYNFGFPSVLKSWIDYVSIPKRTFLYEKDGTAVGLVTGKRAFVLTSRGDNYGDAGAEAGNFADSHACVALKLLGITNVDVIAADGQALDPETRRLGYEAALRKVEEVVPEGVIAFRGRRKNSPDEADAHRP